MILPAIKNKPHLLIPAIILLLLMALLPIQANEGELGNYYGAKNSEKPDWFKESFLEFEEDVIEAKEAGKRVMLYFHQDGCPYCAKLVEENFADPSTKAFIIENFDGITLNMWGDREVVSVAGKDFTEKTFAAALKVQYTPTLIFLDESGKVALRLNGYYPPEDFRAAINYVAEKLETKLSFADYRMQNLLNKQGQLLSEDFFIENHNLQQLTNGSNKPLAVYFEAVDCAQCRILHQRILVDQPTRKLVVEANNVQLNIVSQDKVVTPNGKETTVRDWASDLGIDYTPSIVFFDERGQEVMRISAFVKTFHFQSVYAYVLEKAYLDQPKFQRYIAARGEKFREAGYDIDIFGYQSFHE